MPEEKRYCEVESSYHASEVAQHGIGFSADTAMNTANNIVTFKMVVRIVAKRHGVHATFMPKPRRDLQGSAMKLAFALTKDGKNVFEDENDPNNIMLMPEFYEEMKAAQQKELDTYGEIKNY